MIRSMAAKVMIPLLDRMVMIFSRVATAMISWTVVTISTSWTAEQAMIP